MTGTINETYCLVPVRPDWHEPADLLGYMSRIGATPQYVTTDVLRFIARAWAAIADHGVDIGPHQATGVGKQLAAAGDRKTLDAIPPYWLCLDEMNLAPVEQYFADYLSVLETCSWEWDGEHFVYTSDPLLKASVINEAGDQNRLRNNLGLDDQRHDALWDHFCQHGIGIPFNLLVAGTVNMDETTHGFSRKVIDRALSFDFGTFFPTDFRHFFNPSTCHIPLTYPRLSRAEQTLLPAADTDGSLTIAFMENVNAVLADTPFELAYRALNELLLAVTLHAPRDRAALQAVWDDFLMCKVLPRIEGDLDTLGCTDANGSLLSKLQECLQSQITDTSAPPRQKTSHLKIPSRQMPAHPPRHALTCFAATWITVLSMLATVLSTNSKRCKTSSNSQALPASGRDDSCTR